MTQQRYCATAPLRNSATALSPTVGICAAGNRVGICAACRGQRCRGKIVRPSRRHNNNCANAPRPSPPSTLRRELRYDQAFYPRFGGSIFNVLTIFPSLSLLQQRHRAIASPSNTAAAQQRYSAGATLHRSTTVQQRHWNSTTAQERHRAGASEHRGRVHRRCPV